MSSENLFYGIRVTGRFATVSTRTAARQEAPYRPLAEATERRIRADLTKHGRRPRRLPDARLRAGHLRRRLSPALPRRAAHAGGHAFDFVLEDGVVEISTVSEMRLSLPTSGPFLAADLHGRDMEAEIRKSEG